MTTFYIILLAGIIFFTAYYAIVMKINDNDEPESLSATSYLWKGYIGQTWPFTLFCFVSALTILPIWLEKSSENLQFLVFLSCLGIMTAGTTPLFREKDERLIDYIGGYISFLCGVLWVILSNEYYVTWAIICIGSFWMLFDKLKYVYIFEVVAYLAIAVRLLLFN